ncbi:transmembrane protein 163 isoform X2 [Struthio camelus]|uniref:transmembrane protein 163 isoform X2 n=1 Tax=Struthio camelus TaxID=8801 RepID=UPI003603F81B
MEPSAAALDSTPDPAIVQPPATSPPVPSREQQHEQLRIGESEQFSEGLEDRGLLESSTRLKPHEAQSYRKKALWVSWVSIIVTLALAVAAFTVSVMRYSASSFGFAFDATLDVLSSVIVLWRYSNAAAVHSAHREYIACVILGVIFLLSSICIVIKAIHDLAKKVLPEVLLPPIPEPCTSSRNETGWLSQHRASVVASVYHERMKNSRQSIVEFEILPWGFIISPIPIAKPKKEHHLGTTESAAPLGQQLQQPVSSSG